MMISEQDPDDAIWIAKRMLLEAGAEAARLRRQASAQTATICAAAEREAETIWQQASARTAAIREAAEREAAELRATVIKVSSASAAESTSATITEAKPVRKPKAPPRQLAAIRVAAAATAALLLFALAAGTVEIALHGFAFFVFRSAGTGETPGSGLQENQGPGQPGAPKPAPRQQPLQGRP
jgi:hypothetical protein